MFAAFASVSAMKNFASTLMTGDAALGRFAANLGSTPQTISAWGLAVERIGGNAQATMGSIQALSDKLLGLKIMGKGLPPELSVLASRGGQGIDIGGSPQKALLDIATNLQNIAKKEGRATASWLGRSIGIDADTVNLMIDRGPALRAELEKMKELAPTDKDVAEAQRLQNAWVGLQQTAIDLGRKIVTELSPAFQQVIKQFGEWISLNKDDIKKAIVEFGDYIRGDGGKQIATFFKDLALIVSEIANGIRLAVGYAQTLGDYVSGIKSKIGEAGGKAPNTNEGYYARRSRERASVGGGASGGAPAMSESSGGLATPSAPSAAPSSTGALPNVGETSVGGGLDRSRFRRELEETPGLKEKIMAIAAGEQGDPSGNLAVIETMMNRASMMGTSLAHEARTTGERGYYAGYNPAALGNSRTRSMIESNLNKALGGSNVSNYATDNASQAWGWNRMHGMYQMDYTAGGEYFGHPVQSNARGAGRYAAWKASAATPSASVALAPSNWASMSSGAGLAAAQSAPNSYSNTSSEWNIHGPINLTTAIRDADEFQRELPRYLAMSSGAYLSQSGAQ